MHHCEEQLLQNHMVKLPHSVRGDRDAAGMYESASMRGQRRSQKVWNTELMLSYIKKDVDVGHRRKNYTRHCFLIFYKGEHHIKIYFNSNSKTSKYLKCQSKNMVKTHKTDNIPGLIKLND